jgi:surface protein
MYGMFYEAFEFNGNVSSWDVSKVTTFEYMFYDAAKFNQALCWNTADASVKSDMFTGSQGELLPYPSCLPGANPTSSPTKKPTSSPTKKQKKGKQVEQVKEIKPTKAPKPNKAPKK